MIHLPEPLTRAYLALTFLCLASAAAATAQNCIDCHRTVTPKAASDWQLSKHSDNGIVCTECHSQNFAREELEKDDEMIREADHLLAEGIRVIASLYEDGTLPKPESYAHAFPDLLTFHANPDYALWYGGARWFATSPRSVTWPPT